MTFTSIQHYNKMQNFLLFKGKKHRIESLFKDTLLFSARNNKSSLKTELNLCGYNCIPCIRIKTKKNRKKTLNKITSLSRSWAEKRFLSVFSKQLRENTSQNFSHKLKTQIESLSKERNHSLRLNTEKLHRLAKKSAPSKWFLKS